MPPILSLRSTAWDWFRRWISSGASRVLHEPPDAEPHVRWCGRTAGVTPPPTRSSKFSVSHRQLNGKSRTGGHAYDVGRHHDQKLIVIDVLVVHASGVGGDWDAAQEWVARQTARVVLGDKARHDSRLFVLQGDAAAVLAVQNDGNSIDALAAQRADIQFDFQAHIGVGVDDRCGFHVQSKVLEIKRWERGDVGLVSHHLGNGAAVVYGCEGRIQDGIALPDLENGRSVL